MKQVNVVAIAYFIHLIIAFLCFAPLRKNSILYKLCSTNLLDLRFVQFVQNAAAQFLKGMQKIHILSVWPCCTSF